MRGLPAIWLALAGVGGLVADELFIPGFDPKTRIYIVRPGDTLWDLSGAFFNDPWKWPRIWYNNPQVENPHLIYPGDPLVIPRLKPAATAPVEATPPPLPEEAPPPVVAKPAPKPKPKPKPAKPQPRPQPVPEPVTPETLMGFGEEALQPRVVIEERKQPELPPGLYVRIGNEGIVEGELPYSKVTLLGTVEEERTIFAKGDRVYLGTRGESVEVGQRFFVVERRGEIEDPETGDELGEWVVFRGILEVKEVKGEVAIAEITASYDSIEKHHYLLPYVERTRSFFPHFNPNRIEGRVVLLQEGLKTVGSYQVVYAAMGRDKGVREGDYVRILREQGYRRDREGEKYPLPPYEIARGIVIEVGEKVSTVLVVGARTDVQVKDLVVTAQEKL